MDTDKILSELSNNFGVRLDIKGKKYPDREEVTVRPLDFEVRKGFSIISKLEWLSLNTSLKFDSFSGDILNSIMKNHRDKVDIMIDNINMLVKRNQSGNLLAEVDRRKISEIHEEIDLAKLTLSINNPTINLDNNTVEDHISNQQKIILGLVLLLFDLEEQVEPESEEIEGLPEGSKTKIEVNKYERSKINRQACINYHGYSCKICEFNFEEMYGETGKNYIHVHHIVPVSMMSENYIVNPIKDLLPVCPNCHAMIHRSNPPLSVNKLQNIIQNK